MCCTWLMVRIGSGGGMTMYEKWKPINYGGSIYSDPRDELRARARRAQDGNDSYVAIPGKLAIACSELRECNARTILTGDEDGPLNPPLEIKCRKPEGHPHMHYNGYVNWENRA